MKNDRKLSCQEVCGQTRHCGNKHCSAHPNYIPPTPKNMKRANKRRRDALHPKKTYGPAGGKYPAY